VNDTVQKISAGNSLVLKTADSLKIITDFAKRISTEISEINAASKEQAANLTEVNNTMKLIHEAAESNLKITEKAIELDEMVKKMAVSLYGQVSKFSVGMNDN
jgi:methyl-accepting chemotaxis protein